MKDLSPALERLVRGRNILEASDGECDDIETEHPSRRLNLARLHEDAGKDPPAPFRNSVTSAVSRQ